MSKVAIVINGPGGVGKDTLCELAARHFKVRNVSSITPIKEIAAMCGWHGEKDDKATGGLVNRLGENRSYRLTVPQHRRVIMQQASLSPSSSPIPTCMGLGQGRHQGVLFPMVWEGGGRRIQDGEHMYTHG